MLHSLIFRGQGHSNEFPGAGNRIADPGRCSSTVKNRVLCKAASGHELVSSFRPLDLPSSTHTLCSFSVGQKEVFQQIVPSDRGFPQRLEPSMSCRAPGHRPDSLIDQHPARSHHPPSSPQTHPALPEPPGELQKRVIANDSLTSSPMEHGWMRSDQAAAHQPRALVCPSLRKHRLLCVRSPCRALPARPPKTQGISKPAGFVWCANKLCSCITYLHGWWEWNIF